MVLREIEEGVKHDALWLQALSESKLDPAQTKLRYNHRLPIERKAEA